MGRTLLKVNSMHKKVDDESLTGEEQGVVLGVGHHPFSKKREFNGYGLKR